MEYEFDRSSALANLILASKTASMASQERSAKDYEWERNRIKEEEEKRRDRERKAKMMSNVTDAATIGLALAAPGIGGLIGGAAGKLVGLAGPALAHPVSSMITGSQGSPAGSGIAGVIDSYRAAEAQQKRLDDERKLLDDAIAAARERGQ